METGISEPVAKQEHPPQIESKDAHFRKQFEARQKGETPNGEFEYVHIVPDNPEGDPLIFHPGWLADIKVCEPLAREADSLNQESYFLDLIGHKPPETTGDEAYDRYTLRNAQVMAQIALDNDIKHVNLIGHSEGTSVALVAAQLLLDQGVDVKSVVLVNPTGYGLKPSGETSANLPPLTRSPGETSVGYFARKTLYNVLSKAKGPTTAELAMRGIKMMQQEGQRSKTSDSAPVALDWKHAGRHLPHVLNEGAAMAKLDMAKLQEEVISRGVNVSVLQSEDDPFVRMQDLNTEIQLAEQRNRQAQVSAELEKTKGLSINERNERLEKRVADLRKQEEERTITTAIGKPGHLFAGHYPNTYMPTVIDRIRHLRKQEMKSDIQNRPKAIGG